MKINFEDGKEVVQILCERFGSLDRAAVRLNTHRRYLVNWLNGLTAISPKIRVKIICHLEGDDPLKRRERIDKYAELVKSQGHIW